MADDEERASRFGREASSSMAGFSASLRAAVIKLGDLKREMRAATGEALNWNQVASKAVDKFAEAVKKGDAEGAAKLKKSLNELRVAMPEAFAAGTEAAKKFDKASSTTFTGTVEQAATAHARITNIANAYAELGIASTEQGKAAVAASIASQGSLYHLEGALNELRELEMERKATAAHGIDTTAIDERIANKRIVLAEKTKKTTIAGQLQMKAVAETASQGLTTALSKDAGAFGALAKSAVDSKGIVGTAMKSIMKQEALGAAGVATGGMAGALGGGASAVIGSLAKALGPLSGALTGAALISRVVIGIFEGLGNSSRVAGHQMRALAMNTNVDMGVFNMSMMGSYERIRSFAGITDTAGIMVRSTFDKEILPAAQKALLTFNTLDRSKGTIDNWAGAIAGAAVEGQAMGFSYEKSIGIITRLGGTFGNSAEKTREGFRKIAGGAKLASLTSEEFTSSLGDMDDIARRLGSGGMGVIGAMGMSMARSGVQSGAQRQAMLGGVSGLMGDQSRLLGLGTAVFGPGMMEKYVGAHRAKDSGRAMADLTMSVLGGVGGGKAGTIGGMSPMQALKSGNANQAFEASKLMEFSTGMSSEAFLNQDFSKKYEKFLAGPQTEKEKFALEKEAAAISGDMTKQGMMSMIEQKSVLENILGAVNHIGNIIGAYAAGGIGAVVRGVDARTDEERISTKPAMEFSSGRRSK